MDSQNDFTPADRVNGLGKRSGLTPMGLRARRLPRGYEENETRFSRVLATTALGMSVVLLRSRRAFTREMCGGAGTLTVNPD